MKTRTKNKLARIEDGHDWDQGQVRGHGGTAYSSTDTCRYCGIERQYFTDEQNGVDESYTFRMPPNFKVIPLRDVPETCADED